VHEEKETAEKEEQDPRHSLRSLRSPERNKLTPSAPSDAPPDHLGPARAACTSPERPPWYLKRKRSTPSTPSDAPPDLLLAKAARTLQSNGDVHEEKETAEKVEQDPRHSLRSLRSPERNKLTPSAPSDAPPDHLRPARAASTSPERPPWKRKRSTPSTPFDAPPDLLVARAARTLQSSTTAQKRNDWTCPRCGNVNWFRRGYCIGGNNECLTPREPSWMPGDWFCECGNHNLKRRTVCNRTKCGLARAQGEKPRIFSKQSG
jgi:hypothetical protein